MTRFQLVLRRDGENDQIERSFDDDGEPEMDRRLMADGEVRVLERLLRRDGSASTPRFVCSLVVEPTAP